MILTITFVLCLSRSYAYVDVYNEDRNLFECGGSYMSTGNCPTDDKEMDYQKTMERLVIPQVALMSRRNEKEIFEYRCSGVLITRRHVLTAAWCFTQFKYPKSYEVRIGSTDYTQGQKYVIRDIKFHEGYKFGAHHDNIALATLAQAVEDPNVGVACLPDENLAAMNLTDLGFHMAGWGRVPDESNPILVRFAEDTISNICNKDDSVEKEPWNARYYPAEVLNGADVLKSYTFHISRMRVTSNKECNTVNETKPDSNKTGLLHACRLEGEKDVCVGARGSSLMLLQGDRWFVVGVRSLMPDCLSLKNSSVVYARLSFYGDWIRNNIRSSILISQFDLH